MFYDFTSTHTGNIPDRVIIERQEAERLGKRLDKSAFFRIGRPLPAAVLLHRGAYPVALWRVKVCETRVEGTVTKLIREWREHGIYAMPESECLYLVQDETAVEVDALPVVIRAMFDGGVW